VLINANPKAILHGIPLPGSAFACIRHAPPDPRSRF